ncbi:MAG: diacylglycerol kinase family lipid kinase [Deltaproteobacteria bacterium]|nr:diacylglycerol kinase family lipid kinase [Deltaproteobacteria bacterium]
MVKEKIVFIVNPGAGNGATGKEWPRLEALARDRLGPFETRFTEYPGHAGRLARESLLSGADVVVCVGGDGTLNEVINGFMTPEGAVSPKALLGFIPRGTGGDLVKTIPIPGDPDAALSLIASRNAAAMDLGRITYQDHEGGTATRYFHNVLSFGLGGEVDARVNRTTKMFGGFFSFIWATLISIVTYKNRTIRLTVDDGETLEVVALNVAVANGQYHGGGMWVAPDARVNDGVFHVTIIGDLSTLDIFRSLPLLYNGKICSHAKVTSLQARRVTASSPQRVLLDMDGEQPGLLPADIEVVPSAIQIICGELEGMKRE